MGWIIALLFAIAVAGWTAVLVLSRKRAAATMSEPPAHASIAPDATYERDLLTSALDNAETGIVVTDPRGLVVFANPSAQRFIGARHGEAVAEARLGQMLAEVQATQRPVRDEIDLYTPIRRVLGLTGAPLTATGGAVMFVEDLSERRRVDEIRRDFVANVGHELRTPLGAMAILAEALTDSEDEGERLRLGERVTYEANRMAKIIEDLLELAKVESTGSATELVTLESVIAEAVPPVQVTAADQGVKLVVDLPAAEWSVRGSAPQLVSAISNLLENAVKYTAVSGRQSQEVRLTVAATGPWLSVVVVDQGIGIPPSHHERIFERFYRVDRGRSRDSGGTGLGLSIVRHVAINHGGEVLVESAEGLGSTFTLRLPRADT